MSWAKYQPKKRSAARKETTDPNVDMSRNVSKDAAETSTAPHVSVPPLTTLTYFADAQKNTMQHKSDRNIKAQDQYNGN
jgi:hypothetical protein